MPPPSCTGMETAPRIASTAGPLTGLPAKAPLRSTMCSQVKPWASKARACAAGSSLKTVACAISPRFEPNAAAVLQIDGGVEDHGARPGAAITLLCLSAHNGECCFPVKVALCRHLRLRGPAAPRRLSEADAIDIWIARWLRIRRKDLIARYGCDPRRLYEIWEEKRFTGSRDKALELFRERHPTLLDRVDCGPHRRIPRGVPAELQPGLFDQLDGAQT